MFTLGRLGVIVLCAGMVYVAVAPESLWTRSRSGSRTLAAAVSGGAAALAVLALAFLNEDWRFAYVVGHARPDVAWPLRLAGVWAGPEGSLVLWTVMLATATGICARIDGSSMATRVLAGLTAAYGTAILTVASPFERLAAPPGAGNGLQPVLEHPAMVWHPPILYLGLIGLLVPMALILGAGFENRPAPPAVDRALPLSLATLTAGLATGANWAYVELGWGGYWAWDPIENAGLVAWLTAGSLLHRRPGEAEPGIPRRQGLLAAITGIAVIWATTITRTGVLNSVHAFADRPGLRLVLTTIAVAFTLGVGLLVLRSHPVGSGPAPPMSARSPAGAIVLLLAAGVVAIGTYEPALEMLVRDETFTISGRFYSVLLWPVAVVGAGLGVRSALRAPSSANRVLAASALAAVLAMAVVGAGAGAGAGGLGLAAAGGAVAGATVATRPKRGWPAHIGIGILLVGVAGTTAATTTSVVALTDQEAITAIGRVTHQGVELVDNGPTVEAVATVDIVTGSESGQERSEHFEPKLVSYVRTGASSAEVDTHRGWLADTQVVLIDGDADRATYRLSRQPGISFVWIGAAVITLGLLAAGVAPARRAPAGPADPTMTLAPLEDGR